MIKGWKYWAIIILLIVYGDINRYIANSFWILLDLIPFSLILFILYNIEEVREVKK